MSKKLLRIILLILGFAGLVIIIHSVVAWTPVPVVNDQNVFMPGTQPGDAGTFESPGKCDNCHGGYDPAVEPDHNWRGSMMAQAARDPLWLACLTVSEQDSIWAVGNPNAGDICIRCHSPTGWLEGRSDPVNTASLTGDDFWGVQCDFCHRMVDPYTELGQPDVPPDTDPTAIALAGETYTQDITVLSSHSLFNGTPFLNTTTNLPAFYGNGSLPNYVEHGAGQFFVDPSSAKRGPYYDPDAKHQFYYSRFHKSKNFCSACHDVSNPVLASALIAPDAPERLAPQSYYHVERTSSEFMLSAYGEGGSTTKIAGVAFADKCQDCHMRDVMGKGCNKASAPVRTDIPLHDFTGGNVWMSDILASADQTGPSYDQYNYEVLSGSKYPGAQVDVVGLQGYGQQILDARDRARVQLGQAANLTRVNENRDNITLRINNNAGHKLISGFPEGRRMFLNIKFYDYNGTLIEEVNPYEPLNTTQDVNGNEIYITGGNLVKTHEELVWECEMSSSLTGENKTFHFALADNRYKDNRIPPKGFNTSGMYERLAQPRWNGMDAPGYFTSEEYAGGYDEVTVEKPPGTLFWNATLLYQTTSKEYIEFLRDEINGNATTLTNPTPSGEPEAYIIQTDPFFDNLRGWGDAIWDLWLHNNGSAPVMMTYLNLSSDFYIHLEPGFNLISLGWLWPTDYDLWAVLQSIDGDYNSVQYYDISDTQDHWKHNSTRKPNSLNDLHELNQTMGFWIFITNPNGTYLRPSGVVTSEPAQIDLKPGWNLVGFPSLSNKNRTVALNNLVYGTDVNAIWTFNAITKEWIELGESDNFEIGKGYWIHSNVETTWMVPK